jgi:hypothetical protein
MKLAKNGVHVLRGGEVDVRAGDAELDGRPMDVDEPSRPAAARPAPATPSRFAAESFAGQQPRTRYAQAKTVSMVYQDPLRKLEYDTKRGELIEAAAVQKTVAGAIRALRDGVFSPPDRQSTTLAAESDAIRIHVTLRTELYRELEASANAIEAI